jgi:integrase
MIGRSAYFGEIGPMPTQMRLHKLSARTAATLSKPGRHSDGGNLFLVVDESGARRWVFLFKLNKRQREVGLGPFHIVSLAEAREKAAEYRRLLYKGIDPLDRKRAAAEAATGRKTFGECADALLAAKRSEWRSEKHAAQWAATLRAPCAAIRDRFVDEIDTTAVLKVLTPLWAATPETAMRIRGRIESVLGFAQAQGWRSGDNPARWQNHLSTILPRRQKLTKGHHSMMDYREVPAFLASLPDTVSAMSFRFLILTACRSSEALGARWSEIDMTARTWSIGAGRMKAAVEHVIPLSKSAIEIVGQVAAIRCSEFIFPGRLDQQGLSDSPLRALLGDRDATIHGFRAGFRTWAAETGVPRENAEACLAHATGNAVELAYQRSTYLERRREVMEAWARFCGGGL